MSALVDAGRPISVRARDHARVFPHVPRGSKPGGAQAERDVLYLFEFNPPCPALLLSKESESRTPSPLRPTHHAAVSRTTSFGTFLPFPSDTSNDRTCQEPPSCVCQAGVAVAESGRLLSFGFVAPDPVSGHSFEANTIKLGCRPSYP